MPNCDYTARIEEQSIQRVVVGLVADLELPRAYIASVLEHYVPVINWLSREMSEHAGSTYVFGIHGAQGSGKTTLSELFRRYFQIEEECSVVSISIDDFYLTRQERQSLAATVHPLLATRGPPGTHDVGLALETLQGIRALSVGESIKLPRFDKGADDRAPESKWSTVCGPVDLVILEGWCVGSEPVEPDSLQQPVNALEENEDEHGVWRRFVNDRLSSYQPMFDLIDGLLMLRVPSFETVLEWRIKQERKLRQSHPDNTNHIMTETDISRFVQFFERLTVASDATVAMKADVIIDLGTDHQPYSIDIIPGEASQRQSE